MIEPTERCWDVLDLREGWLALRPGPARRAAFDRYEREWNALREEEKDACLQELAASA